MPERQHPEAGLRVHDHLVRDHLGDVPVGGLAVDSFRLGPVDAVVRVHHHDVPAGRVPGDVHRFLVRRAQAHGALREEEERARPPLLEGHRVACVSDHVVDGVCAPRVPRSLVKVQYRAP
eukprot:7134408-Pyramimonas_sp.AAC.1